MVILQLTEFIFHIWPINDFEDHSQGFEKIKRSIDGSEPNPFLFLKKALVKFLRAQWPGSIEKFLIDKKPGMAHTDLLLSEKVFKKPFTHRKLRREWKYFH